MAKYMLCSGTHIKKWVKPELGFLMQSQMLLIPKSFSLEFSRNLTPCCADGFHSRRRGSFGCMVPGLQSACPVQCPHLYCVNKKERIQFKHCRKTLPADLRR